MTAQRKPNILFLFPDSHRGDWMPYEEEVFRTLGMEPLNLRMPNVRRLMDEGVTFTKAVTPAPLCAPARACLAAGVPYSQCGTASNEVDFPLDKKTFYSVLRDRGYRVAGVGKFDLHKPTQWWGLDGWIPELETLGFTDGIDNAGKIDAVNSGVDSPKDPYMKYLHERGLAELHVSDMKARKGGGTEPTELPEEAYCDNWLTQNGVRLLRKLPTDQPWFLMVNFTGPHGPWDVTKSMREAWAHEELPLPHGWDRDDGAKVIEIRRNYAAMLENIDRNIGLLLEEVAVRGELDNTIVVYASDHGEMLGDYNRFGKCVANRGSVHIPMVIQGPDIRQGFSSDALVELQDLAATFAEYAGGTMPEVVGSISLKPLLEGNAEWHRDYQSAALDSDGKHTKLGWRMTSDGRYKLTQVEGQEPELFDLLRDPWETANIAGDEPAILARFLEHALGDVL